MSELHDELVIPLTPAQWNANFLSMNQRLSHHPKNDRTQYWRQLLGALARSQRVLRVPGRGRVEIWFRFPVAQRREVANLQPTSKAIVDGLVDAGVFEDDRDELVVGPDNRRTWPNGPHEVRVKIFKEGS
ncbi:hypothetical protein [Glutamicibacter sp. 2E12]|uniref:hypothetical protein n=1 Tax=Glutamicibacter sp. 2E12 TaxID=3416181 RepID=UPI003CE6CAC1